MALNSTFFFALQWIATEEPNNASASMRGTQLVLEPSSVASLRLILCWGKLRRGQQRRDLVFVKAMFWFLWGAPPSHTTLISRTNSWLRSQGQL